jgi:hypothetical protein
MKNMKQSPTVDVTRVNRYSGDGFSDTTVKESKNKPKIPRFKK